MAKAESFSLTESLQLTPVLLIIVAVFALYVLMHKRRDEY